MKLTPAIVAVFVLTAPAFAAPTLRAAVTVTGDVVTIGDMFGDAGGLAGTPIFRAPAPGTTGIVPLAAVQNAARLAGLTDFDVGGNTSVSVQRASKLVDATALAGLIEADLEQTSMLPSGATARIDFDIAGIAINAAATAVPATLVNLRYVPGQAPFAARFQIAGIDQPVDITGSVTLMTTAPRLVANAAAGTILAASDFEMAPVALATAQAGGYADLDQLVGKQLLRASHAGVSLKPTDVGAPTVVTRNSLVTVLFHQASMTLTVKGQALSNAAAGDPVDVLNTVTRKILHGVAQPDGTIAIDAPVTVAGL